MLRSEKGKVNDENNKNKGMSRRTRVRSATSFKRSVLMKFGCNSYRIWQLTDVITGQNASSPESRRFLLGTNVKQCAVLLSAVKQRSLPAAWSISLFLFFQIYNLIFCSLYIFLFFLISSSWKITLGYKG
jgi:hypothetical protein